jgi:GntR family transcriptional repressor for pyruvate dehydrogenase complex
MRRSGDYVDSGEGWARPAGRGKAFVWLIRRQVIREATKRLSHLGLVRIQQGDGTRVLDYLDTAGLDLLSVLATTPTAVAGGPWLLASVLEMRSAIGADLARLCAKRGTASLRQRLVRIAEDIAAARSDEQMFDLDVQFWDLVREGADNVAYRLAYNTLKRSALSIRAQIVPWQAREIRIAEHRVPLAKAIAAGDPKAAEARAIVDFRGALDDILAMLATARTQPVARAVETPQAGPTPAPTPKTAERRPRVRRRPNAQPK